MAERGPLLTCLGLLNWTVLNMMELLLAAGVEDVEKKTV